MRGVFFTLCPSIGPKERSRQALDRLPIVSNFITNFWMQHFDGARISPNSVLNAVWHALNEHVCQYLRSRNPRCSTVYIDNSLGALVRDSPCRSFCVTKFNMMHYLSSVCWPAGRPTDSQLKTTTRTNCCIYTLYLLMMG